MSNVDQLVDLFLNDAAFHDALLSDPDAAIQASGIELTEDDRAALHTTLAQVGAVELANRVSKGGSAN